MKFKVGDKLIINNAKRLECDKFWGDGTEVIVYRISDEGIMHVHDIYGQISHEIYFDEYHCVELVNKSQKGRKLMRFKEGDLIEFVDVDKIIGNAKKYYKNGDVVRIDEIHNNSIRLHIIRDGVISFVVINDEEFEYIRHFSKAVIHKENVNLADAIVKELDKKILDWTIDRLLDERDFETLKRVVKECEL